MSAKSMDKYNRWRNKTVAFRVSPEEADQLDRFVAISGLTKQDYLTRRILLQEVTIVGSSRVYKALRIHLEATLTELKRIEAGQSIDEELLDLLRLMIKTLYGMKEDANER